MNKHGQSPQSFPPESPEPYIQLIEVIVRDIHPTDRRESWVARNLPRTFAWLCTVQSWDRFFGEGN